MSAACPTFIEKTDVSGLSGSSRLFLLSFDNCSVITYSGQGSVPGIWGSSGACRELSGPSWSLEWNGEMDVPQIKNQMK